MKRALLALLLCAGMAAAVSAAPATDPSLLLWLPLDEGSGDLAVDRSKNQLEGDLTNVQWADGAFGKAARFGGDNSFIELPPVPALNGAKQCTISLWATWEGTGRYPNLLSTHTWSPGGFLIFVNDNSCSFRLGMPGQRAGTANSKWTEISVSLLPSLPIRQWTHLCVIFDLPNITAYVNGKAVAKGKWEHPIEADGIRLGGWTGPVCHNGLMRDVRIYGRALAAAEIVPLAQTLAGASAAYTLVDESKTPRPMAATFSNDRATLAIDTRGRIASLRDKPSGRELLAKPRELVSARLKDGRQITARKATLRDGLLAFEFAGRQGSATLAIEPRKQHFTIAIRALTVPDVANLTFFNLLPVPVKYQGAMANMLSDDSDAVCLRGYELPVEMAVGGIPPGLRVSTTAEHGLTGWRAGLAAGPKSEMPAMLREMAADAGVPISKLGGPWSLGAEANRGSYLFADLSLASVDDWIELARRGGFTHIHIHGWWSTLGHYGVNPSLFPNGLADMKEAVAKIHAAGLKAGIHTLTACIDPRDAWVTPEASPDLIASASYTLARPMTPADTVIYVNEKPAVNHDVVFTYTSNGNAIRIGSEIVQYSEVVSEPPYAFAKCNRGAFKTRPAAHAAGDQADYLQQRYIAFYPKPESPLANELADCIAKVFNTCQLDQIYFDGSEGMMSRYGIDFMRHAIFKRLRGDVLVEASAHGAHNWWFHSRLGAWDHPVWAAKRFQDLHIASASKSRDADLLEPQMGWWAPRKASPQARGHFLDEMEYFAVKNLGLDAAMSVQGVNVSQRPLGFYIEKQFTALGWYEQLRLARYFDAETLARISKPGEEFRLRQGNDGTWQFTPVHFETHRISSLGNGSERWTIRNPLKASGGQVRIEALYSAAPYDDPKRICAADFADLAAFQKTTSSAAVAIELKEATGETRGDGRNLQLRAENKGGERRGAWAKAGLAFPAPYKNLSGTGALGLWVKGDGKGAVLNMQVATPREFMHALSDHYVVLDFVGWRYVELLLRERDVERMNDYQWPYAGTYDLYRNPVDMAHVSGLNLYLNNLPPGTATDVVVSPIMALPVQPVEIKNPALRVGDHWEIFNVTLKSGQFLELDDSFHCTHYDEQGEPLARIVPFASLPNIFLPVLADENKVEFRCDRPARGSARAEVTYITSGEPFGTPNPRDKIDFQRLRREYEMPRPIFNPISDHNIWQISVRPGERAKLEIELAGQMENPVLTINFRHWRFLVALKTGQKLVCLDGQKWMVLDAKRAIVAEGTLDAPLPVLKKWVNHVEFACEKIERAVVKLVKVYQP